MIEYNSIKQRWQWIKDKYPLCWNFESPRSWEEPWVLSQIENIALGSLLYLDCGCGRGGFSSYIAERFKQIEVHACDYFESGSREGGGSSELSAELAKKNVTYHEQDMRSMTFDSCSFDLVTCISVLEHIKESKASLLEMIRVLKPGGHLVVTVDVMLEKGWEINKTLDELAEVLICNEVRLLRPDRIPDPVELGTNPDVWHVSPQTWYLDWTPRIWNGKDYKWRWQSSIGYVVVKN